jgi:hypothetical protein
MSIIEASSVRVQTMADGTLRLIVDIEPRNARDAFGLFGSPGTAIALAALKDGGEPMPAPTPAPAAKGGPLARLAGMWCESAEFRGWMFTQGWPGLTSADAATYIHHACGIKSRAELDANEAAAETFHRVFRGPYSKHLISIGAIT